MANDNIVLVTRLQKYIKQFIFNYKGDNLLPGTSKKMGNEKKKGTLNKMQSSLHFIFISIARKV